MFTALLYVHSGCSFLLLFLLSIPYYYLLDYISYYLVFVKKVSGKALWLVIICLLAVCMLAIFTLNAFTGLIAMLLVLQLAMVVFFIFRRRYLETSGKY